MKVEALQLWQLDAAGNIVTDNGGKPMPGRDSQGNEIQKVYAKRPPYYAVYRAIDRVTVQFADDNILDSDGKPLESNQRLKFANINGLRAQIHGLIDGWRSKDAYSPKAEGYNARVAAALILCFEGDTDNAKAGLAEIKSDVLAELNSRGRFEYLQYAAGLAILIALVLGIAWLWSPGPSADARIPLGTSLWLSGIGGVIGALFSIALGIRGRTILTNLNQRDNMADAILRVAIGLIAAWALLLLLRGGLVTSFKLGDAELSGDKMKIEALLLIGFFAGFFERLVPDMLEKVSKKEKLEAASGGTPVAAASGAPAAVAGAPPAAGTGGAAGGAAAGGAAGGAAAGGAAGGAAAGGAAGAAGAAGAGGAANAGAAGGAPVAAAGGGTGATATGGTAIPKAALG